MHKRMYNNDKIILLLLSRTIDLIDNAMYIYHMKAIKAVSPKVTAEEINKMKTSLRKEDLQIVIRDYVLANDRREVINKELLEALRHVLPYVRVTQGNATSGDHMRSIMALGDEIESAIAHAEGK